ncbi:hypothetical protein CEUSTIGMA_g3971.t1 [Chlamydomonas eustigma]|uniref:Uncharacterized protein n=1 Tax=Chlamydomonas eustigma TaxID=1157962 RepID=A0A250X0F5_9CHLO|nr:hypothetical protein CEUSTIGMA_g3971.t1 [Chlamydomonas eustigma]|eukprot:GAX76525.1 hypothetical protein CEUSTIGMA_g3971.t1 [Chlamydomonas eustigma]
MPLMIGSDHTHRPPLAIRAPPHSLLVKQPHLDATDVEPAMHPQLHSTPPTWRPDQKRRRLLDTSNNYYTMPPAAMPILDVSSHPQPEPLLTYSDSIGAGTPIVPQQPPYSPSFSGSTLQQGLNPALSSSQQYVAAIQPAVQPTQPGLHTTLSSSQQYAATQPAAQAQNSAALVPLQHVPYQASSQYTQEPAQHLPAEAAGPQQSSPNGQLQRDQSPPLTAQGGFLGPSSFLYSHSKASPTLQPPVIEVVPVLVPQPAPQSLQQLAPAPIPAAFTPFSTPTTPTIVGSGGIHVTTSNPISISNPISVTNPNVNGQLTTVGSYSAGGKQAPGGGLGAAAAAGTALGALGLLAGAAKAAVVPHILTAGALLGGPG